MYLKNKNMKRFIIIFIGAFFGILWINAQSSLVGKWNTGQHNTIVEISELDGELNGKFVSSDNDRVEIGKIMVKDLKFEDGIWKGEIYSMRRESWMPAEFKPEGNELNLEVFAGKRSRKVTWTLKD
jgi:uncharacterized protein (DUF2147 family)